MSRTVSSGPFAFRGGLFLSLIFQFCLCYSAEVTVSETYRKEWKDPVLAKRIDAGIENNRKGNAVLSVVDDEGKPIPGATLYVKLNRHDFLFGCNAFVLGQLETPELNKRYEEIFTKIFNFATVPFYWDATEPKEGETRYEEGCEYIWRRPPVDRFVPFGKKYNVTLKAHPMLWHTHNPEWLPKDPEELKRLYRRRFKEITSRYAKDIAIWEVTNESSGCLTNYPLYSKDKAYVGWAFKEAAPLLRDDNLVMINDYTRFNTIRADKNWYYKQIQGLLAQGAQIEGVGLQFHIWFSPRMMERHLAAELHLPTVMLDTYDDFAKLNLPVYITEVTVPTPKQANGEALQAKVMEDLYRLWFSAPNMKGITYWNLGDSMAYGGEDKAVGGLVDKDLNPKESYKVLDRLINEEWRTQANGKSDQCGQFAFRGFYGIYDVDIHIGSITKRCQVHLSESGNSKHAVVIK